MRRRIDQWIWSQVVAELFKQPTPSPLKILISIRRLERIAPPRHSRWLKSSEAEKSIWYSSHRCRRRLYNTARLWEISLTLLYNRNVKNSRKYAGKEFAFLLIDFDLFGVDNHAEAETWSIDKLVEFRHPPSTIRDHRRRVTVPPSLLVVAI